MIGWIRPIVAGVIFAVGFFTIIKFASDYAYLFISGTWRYMRDQRRIRNAVESSNQEHPKS